LIETTLKKNEKFGGETPQKFIHLANLSELFLAKSFDGNNVKEGRKFKDKMPRNLSMN